MTDPSIDAGLMARVAKGDQGAFATLADRHAGRAHAVATRMLNSRDDAEEVVQDALTRVWRHAPRFDAARSAFGTWFYRIVANGCLDRLRRKAPVTTDIEAAGDIADGGDGAEAGLVRDGRDRGVRAAVQALPANQRLAIVLCYFEDMPQAEAARVMNMNLKAVEALLFRARKTLKAVLSDD